MVKSKLNQNLHFWEVQIIRFLYRYRKYGYAFTVYGITENYKKTNEAKRWKVKKLCDATTKKYLNILEKRGYVTKKTLFGKTRWKLNYEEEKQC